MKKSLILFMLTLMPMLAGAQVKFGYFSYSKVLEASTEYVKAKQDIATLREKFDEEVKRVEDDFNYKYQDFLDEQQSLAKVIRDKRQLELQQMMESNLSFKKESRRLLRQAEDDAMRPVKAKIDQAIRTIGMNGQYAFILNADSNSLPYVDETQGKDVTDEIIAAIK